MGRKSDLFSFLLLSFFLYQNCHRLSTAVFFLIPSCPFFVCHITHVSFLETQPSSLDSVLRFWSVLNLGTLDLSLSLSLVFVVTFWNVFMSDLGYEFIGYAGMCGKIKSSQVLILVCLFFSFHCCRRRICCAIEWLI